jgi:hypothetical protein
MLRSQDDLDSQGGAHAAGGDSPSFKRQGVTQQECDSFYKESEGKTRNTREKKE